MRVHWRQPRLTTIDQIDSVYHEAGGDPFVAAGILHSTQDMRSPTAPAASAAVPTTTRSHSGSGETVRERERDAACLSLPIGNGAKRAGVDREQGKH
jgi:hypothetical protein